MDLSPIADFVSDFNMLLDFENGDNSQICLDVALQVCDFLRIVHVIRGEGTWDNDVKLLCLAITPRCCRDECSRSEC